MADEHFSGSLSLEYSSMEMSEMNGGRSTIFERDRKLQCASSIQGLVFEWPCSLKEVRWVRQMASRQDQTSGGQ